MITLCKYYICSLIGWMVFILPSCADTVSDCVGPVNNLSAPLTVQADALPVSKAQLNEGSFPADTELGLFLRAVDGSDYEGKAVDNSKYVSEGEDGSQNWVTSDADRIWLSAVKGVAYAYYPYVDGATITNVPISNDGTDWMYTAEPPTNLTNKNNVARFHLCHAMTIIRCKVVKGDYQGDCDVASVSVKSPALALEGSINLRQSGLEGFKAVNAPIGTYGLGLVGAEPLALDFWAVPVGVDGALSFEVVADEHTFIVNSPVMRPQSGLVYNFTLTLNCNRLDLSEVVVKPWSEKAEDSVVSEYDPSDQSVEWEVAKSNPGIYAITADGKALDYEYAIDGEYAGVAFVINSKAYQIAKVDALGVDGTNIIYWWKTDYKDIDELTNYKGVDDVNTYAYLPKVDGSYTDVPHLSTDWTHWVDLGVINAAIRNFNGQAETAVLVDLLGTVENTIGKAVVDFRNNASLNEGHTDWFAPSVGQLAAMVLHAVKIEALLSKVVGAEGFYRKEKTDYWTSTEYDATNAWYVGFWDGGCYKTYKYNNRPKRCRLIREL